MRLAERYEQVYASIGVHPHDASKLTPQTLDDLRALVSASEGCRIRRNRPRLPLRSHLRPARDAARSLHRAIEAGARHWACPITIHTREAWDDTMAVLRENWSGEAVMHCFTAIRCRRRKLSIWVFTSATAAC